MNSKEIYRILKEEVQFNETSRNGSTKELKQAFVRWTKRKDEYQLCANGIEGLADGIQIHNREWLYDLVIYKEDHRQGGLARRLKEVTLALESEWDVEPDEIMDDFQKLLQSTAKYKVFVFNGRYEEKEYENSINQFNKSIKEFGAAGSFLIAFYDNTRGEDGKYPAVFKCIKEFD